MKKQISFSGKGQKGDIGGMAIYHILPNRYADAVGPFVFLDHIGPTTHQDRADEKKAGTGPHPHRGIATLSYILNGEAEHFDSRGNYAKVRSGGIQWMKAGNGIVHDENLTPDPQDKKGLTHALQFWINLPAKNKAEKPEYLVVHGNEIPQKLLTSESGWIKVVLGSYEELNSPIPNYSKQFLYHIYLEPEKTFVITVLDNIEVAAFLPSYNAIVNDTESEAGEFIEFDKKEGVIELINASRSANDIIIFGGSPYAEHMVIEGPFVMNTFAEIGEAYRDFHAGKYGEINYNHKK